MSFNWLGVFRVGSYTVFRRFIMNELRSAETRIQTIEAELDRIGEISLMWGGSSTTAAGDTFPGEQRIGFSCSPGTAISNLVQAYIAQGGNPFDISMFLWPGSDWDDDGDGKLIMSSSQPYGGLCYPLSRTETDYRDAGFGDIDSGGALNLKKNPKTRLERGETINWEESERTASQIRWARGWANQAIRDKRNNLEWRIVKLMDLREQLVQEIQMISVAAAGFVSGFDVQDHHPTQFTVASVINLFDGIFYARDETGWVEGWPDQPQVKSETLAAGVYDWLMHDFVHEKWTAL
jgi:hypothetical protein